MLHLLNLTTHYGFCQLEISVFFFLWRNFTTRQLLFRKKHKMRLMCKERFSPLLLTQNHSCSKFLWDLYAGYKDLSIGPILGIRIPGVSQVAPLYFDLHCCQVVLLISWIAWPAANKTRVRLKFLGDCVEYTIKSTTTSSLVWAGSRLRHCQCAAS